MQSTNIVGVQFENVGKIYFFDATPYPELEIDSHVIVNTSRGSQLAKIVQTGVDVQDIKEEIKPIDRPASPRDLMLRQMMAEKEDEAVKIVREHVRAKNFQGIKIVSAEYSFDATRLTLYINAEADPKFNLKGFHQEISQKFQDVRTEIRQIGPRDIAKSLGGMGACGLETRCCSKFLTEFSSISIRMAKTQDISLTPSEITGMCGRLRCCLLYEYDYYVEARKNLPKRKKVIQTPLGEGKVIQVLPLSQSVVVDLPEAGPRQFTLEELETGKIIIPEPVKEKVTLQDEFLHEAPMIPVTHDQTTQEVKKQQSSRRPRSGRRDKRRRK